MGASNSIDGMAEGGSLGAIVGQHAMDGDIADSIHSLPVTPFNPDACLTSLVGGDKTALNLYGTWDHILTRPFAAEDAKSAREIMTQIVKLSPSVTTRGGMNFPLHVPSIDQLISSKAKVPSSLLVIIGLRNPETLSNLFIALTRVAFRFCEQGVYQGEDGIYELNGCDRCVEWIRAFAELFAINAAEIPSIITTSFASATASSILLRRPEDVQSTTPYLSAPASWIRAGWDQYVQSRMLFEFFLSMINVLLFARNYTINSSWVEPSPSDCILHYHIPDEPRLWAFGVGCKLLDQPEEDMTKKPPRGLRLSGVPDEMWARRTNLLEVLQICLSEPFHLTIANWGFKDLPSPGPRGVDSSPHLIEIRRHHPALASALVGGSVVLTANLAVSIIGILEFCLDEQASDSWSFWANESSASGPPIKNARIRECLHAGMRLICPMMVMNQMMFVSKSLSIRGRNVFPSIMANIGEIILNNEQGIEKGTGRLAAILRSLGKLHTEAILKFCSAPTNTENDLAAVLEVSLYLFFFLNVVPYETASHGLPELLTDSLLLNLHLLTKVHKLDHQVTTANDANHPARTMREDAIVTLLHLHFKLATIGRSPAFKEMLTSSLELHPLWPSLALSPAWTPHAYIAPQQSMGETIVLVGTSMMNDFASEKVHGLDAELSRQCFDLMSSAMYNVCLSLDAVHFHVADRLLSNFASWSRARVLFYKPNSPRVVEDFLRLIVCLLKVPKKSQDEVFRNPYVLYAIFRRIDDFERLAGCELPILEEDASEGRVADGVMNFAHTRDFLKWRDTLKPYVTLNELIQKGGRFLVEALSDDELYHPSDVLSILNSEYHAQLAKYLRTGTKYFDYVQTPQVEFFFVTVMANVLSQTSPAFKPRPPVEGSSQTHPFAIAYRDMTCLVNDAVSSPN